MFSIFIIYIINRHVFVIGGYPKSAAITEYSLPMSVNKVK